MILKPTMGGRDAAPASDRRARLLRFGAIVMVLAGAAAASTIDTISGTLTTTTTSTMSAAVGSTIAGATDGTGASASALPLDVIMTRSGSWQLSALTAQGDASVYRMTLDKNPAFVREFACRPLATKEAGKGIALDLLTVRLLGEEATVAQGACRVVQNMQPVTPNLAWIREAVTARVIPAYRRERAFRDSLPSLARDPKRGTYDPRSLGPIPDGSGTPTSSNNFVGTTSAQGGEYVSSRGFIHDADARVVDAALHGETAAVEAFWPEFEQYTFYSLAQPQGANWSAKNHITIDPQFPQDGERGWEVAFYNNPNPAVDSAQEVTNWSRDLAHLENTGFVHWLATEDPVAGLLVQRQAAYALASRLEYRRGGYAGMPAATVYQGYDEQERGLFNTLSALWKSRYVSRRINTLDGRMFWSPARAQLQADQIIAYYDQRATRVAGATAASPGEYTARLTGTPFATIGIDGFAMADGSSAKLQQTSAFETVQYGKEPLWLWTKGGHSTVRRWFTSYATGLAARMAVIGGAMGVDGRASERGSGYPTGPTKIVNGYVVAATPLFTSTTGWAEWVAALPLKQVDSRGSFDGASIHTALQMEGALLMARDAALPIATVETALSRIRAAKSATKSYRFESLQMHKHLGTPQ